MFLKKLLKLFFPILKKLSLFFLLFLVFLFTLFFFWEFFKIKTIRIETDFSSNNITGLDQLKEKNIFFLRTKKLEEKLKEDNSFIKAVSIKKLFPNSLLIQIEFYSPLALVKNNHGYYFILSSDGRILSSIKKKNNLPLINYYQLINNSIYSTGDWLDLFDIKVALNLTEKLQSINLKINSIDIINEDMILFNLEGAKEVVFTSKKEPEKQFFPISIILKQLKIEGREFKRIDVRFDKPIVSF